MRFYRKLYATKRIRDVEETKRKLLRGEGEVDLYVLLLEESGQSISFIHNACLLQPYYHGKNCANIIGMGRGYTDMIELLSSMMEETVRQTGGTDLISYLIPEGVDAAFDEERVLRRKKELVPSVSSFWERIKGFFTGKRKGKK